MRCGISCPALDVARRLAGHTVLGFWLLQLAGIGWSFGSLLQKRVHTQVHPFINGAVQQFAAGLVTFGPALLFERFPATVSLRSELAVVYLIVFGSIVGFSSFVYVVAHLPVAIVSIYTFVNPLVAVFLGWLFFREPFGYREAIAMGIIFAGIGMVRWSEAGRYFTASAPVGDEIGAVTDWSTPHKEQQTDQ